MSSVPAPPLAPNSKQPFYREGWVKRVAWNRGRWPKHLWLETRDGLLKVKLKKSLRRALGQGWNGTTLPGPIQLWGMQCWDSQQARLKFKATQLRPLPAGCAALPFQPVRSPQTQGPKTPRSVPFQPSHQLTAVDGGSLAAQAPAREDDLDDGDLDDSDLDYCDLDPRTGAIAPARLPSSQPIAPQPQAALTQSPAPQTIQICQKGACRKQGGTELCGALKALVEQRGWGDRITIAPTGCLGRCKAAPALRMPDHTRCTRVRVKDLAPLLDRLQHDPQAS